MSGQPKVYDGTTWTDVKKTVDIPPHHQPEGQSPTEPVVGKGNGEIFVSLPSFRDGQRCGATLKALFENAQEPDKVFVGLIEQNDPSDKQCLVEYCQHHGATVGKQGEKLGDGVICPHYDQIRYLAVYNIAAKAPTYARSLARKVLANEEYCLQIDAHTDFTKHWDTVVKSEWSSIGNEFGVLSTVPANSKFKAEYEVGGTKRNEVPRQCGVRIGPQDVPLYSSPADGSAQSLERPHLSHTWSAAFSFAKCHLEESAPYDVFAPLAFDAEQFPRFARFWTRGYDVYTPTINIVYHDYGANPEGHDPKGWTKREGMRQAALKRIKTMLQVRGGDDSQTAQANLGIYGLGKRRTLRQLMDFVGIDLVERTGRVKTASCANHNWVPYDASISPTENMYDNADDLDPQPEYPLRTAATRHLQQEKPPPVELAVVEKAMAEKGVGGGTYEEMHHDEAASIAPLKTIATLWFFGLFVWYMVFVVNNRSSGGKIAVKRRKKASSAGYKSVKSV